ncbi:MAG: stage II sporulation protein E [Clostridiales bacterium]|nr:stage II sporulation protein E [Clostridiales bacterium]
MASFALAACGFLIGRIAVFGDIAPAAVPFAATFFLEGHSFLAAAAFAAAGILTRLPPEFAAKYAVCLAVMAGLNFFRNTRLLRDRTDMFRALTSAALLAVSGVVSAILGGGYLFYIIMALLDGALAFCLTLVMKRGMDAMRDPGGFAALTGEDMISLCLLAGAVVAGSADIYVGPVSLRYFLCDAIIMAMAARGGMSVGCSAGLALGVVVHAAGYESPAFIVALASAGFVGGSLRRFKKRFVAAGYALGLCVVTFYMAADLIGVTYVFSLVFAAVTFLLIPSGGAMAAPASGIPRGEIYAERVKAVFADRLSGASDAFRRLSRAFRTEPPEARLSQKDVADVVDRSALIVCEDCPGREDCWGDGFYDTYRSVYAMLSSLERDGDAPAGMTEAFRQACSDPDRFAQILAREFEVLRTDVKWRARVAESRKLVSEQLDGVSKILCRLAGDVDMETEFETETENDIIRSLSENNIEVDGVTVTKNRDGRYEVNVIRANGDGSFDRAEDEATLIGRVLGRRMKRGEAGAVTRKGARAAIVSFVEEQRYKLSGAVARAARARESGDSYSFMELRRGQCVMALSDGMGHGGTALEESRAAIELLEEFIETGFDRELSVRLINSALLLRSGAETFSTLDICSVDLYTGESEFMKIGASATFIARDGAVSIVRGESLPVGVISDVSADITRKRLKDGDIIVMVTDGVLDSAGADDGDKERFVVEALSRRRARHPQDIADQILDAAIERSGGEPADDMTVVAAVMDKKF